MMSRKNKKFFSVAGMMLASILFSQGCATRADMESFSRPKYHHSELHGLFVGVRGIFDSIAESFGIGLGIPTLDKPIFPRHEDCVWNQYRMGMDCPEPYYPIAPSEREEDYYGQ